MRVCVVGGGISGVSCAYLIRNNTPHDVMLVERGEIGGTARTIYEYGYVVEAGPNGFLKNKEDIKRLVYESGFDREVIESRGSSERRFIFSSGRLYEVSSNPLELFMSGLMSLKGKVRILAEPFVSPLKFDETLEHFVERRLGREMLVKLIGPMAVGIYAADPSSISVESAFPRIKEIEREYGSLTRGLLSLIRERKAETGSASGGFSSGLLSFKRGIGSFVRHLASGVNVFKGTALSIRRGRGGYQVVCDSGIIEADAVVLAVPSYALSGIVEELDESFSLRLKGLNYAPITVVAMGFNKAKLPGVVNAYGYLFSLDSLDDVIGVLFDSSIFEGRAQGDHLLVRVMIGGAVRKEGALRTDSVEIAVRELQRSAGLYAPFDYVRVIRYPRGIPLYTLEHKKVLRALLGFEKRNKNVYITGNAFWGISLNDCVKASYRIFKLVKGT